MVRHMDVYHYVQPSSLKSISYSSRFLIYYCSAHPTRRRASLMVQQSNDSTATIRASRFKMEECWPQLSSRRQRWWQRPCETESVHITCAIQVPVADRPRNCCLCCEDDRATQTNIEEPALHEAPLYRHNFTNSSSNLKSFFSCHYGHINQQS